MIQLKNHQKLPIEFMKYNKGLILYHSTGSGKTITALYCVYQFDFEIIIVGTRSSHKTFIDNIQKTKLNSQRFQFYTYTKIKRLLVSDISIFKNKSVILDEAHYLRNENMYNLYIVNALTLAAKIVLLTATPVVNHLNDLSILVNIVKGNDVLPTEKKLFDQMFYDEEKSILINEKTLIDKIKNSISYYKIDDDANYPSVTDEYLAIEMDYDQIEEYKYYIRNIIFADQNIDKKTDLFNIDYGLLPYKKKNYFLNVTRQLSNTAKKNNSSPKIDAIFEKISSGPYPVIIYSNFIKKGVYTLAILLENANIKYKTITGFTSTERLIRTVNDYNDGNIDVLLISSAGSESLDLKATRQIHIMEPHWNNAKILQVVGRAVRYQSHNMLPLNQRHVHIYHWVSIFPDKIKNLSADQYLIKISIDKQKIWDKYQNIIISASIENNY